MKTVFNNRQLTHVWAHQGQSYGRGNNMSFTDQTIYSYGAHYPAARIHAVKGKQFALVRSDAYSPTTAKHLSYIRSALSGLMPYFCVATALGIDNPKATVKVLDKRAHESIGEALKRLKVDAYTKKHTLESIQYAYELANELRSILGMASIKPKPFDLKRVEAHLDARIKRQEELNTPEMIAKRDKARLRREELREEARLKAIEEKKLKLVSDIEAWRKGEYRTGFRGLLRYDLLRIKGDKVETSRGAEVPLNDALKLYKAIEEVKPVIGARVGSFTVENITWLENDSVIKIGCHNILWSEARAVLGGAA